MKKLELLDAPEPVTDKELAQLENVTVIPSGLIELLRFSNGGMPDRSNSFIDRAVLSNIPCSISVEYLMDVPEIIEALDDYKDVLSASVPFAHDGAGNLICINRNEEIYFWHHESKNGWHKVSNNLNDFIELMGPE